MSGIDGKYCCRCRSREGDATKVAVEKTALHTITETVTASGKIYPETEVKIAPEVSGEITAGGREIYW